MKKIDLPFVLDIAFYAAAVWLLALGILRYFGAPLWMCILCATLLALAVGGVLFLIFYGRRRRARLTASERETREKLLLHLALESDEKVRLALLNACLADGKDAHCKEEGIEVEGALVIPLFTMQPLDADAVARLIKKYRETPFVLACNALTPEAEKLLASFNRTAVRGTEIYELFARTGLPDPLICGEIPRRTARTKLKNAFSKRNARPFFVSGALLLFMSLFTLFPVYYLVTGGILLAVAVCVRMLGFA